MARKKNDPLHKRHLENKLAPLRKRPNPTTPRGGWLKNIREALGMSLQQLAGRLGITAQSLAAMEQAEAEDRITLATLKKVAAALNADVSIQVIPKAPLETMVLEQARKVAREIAAQTQIHMALEDQANSKAFVESRIEEIASELVRKGDRRIWSEK